MLQIVVQTLNVVLIVLFLSNIGESKYMSQLISLTNPSA